MTLAHGPPAARSRQDHRRVRREVGAGGELLHPAADGGQERRHGPGDRARAGSITGEDCDAGETAHAARGFSRMAHRRVKAIAVAWRAGAHPARARMRRACARARCRASREPCRLRRALALAVCILLDWRSSVVRRILLVEHSETGLVGGSLTGLLHLVRALDRSAYTSTLLLYEQKPLDGALAGTGCRVLVLPASGLGRRVPVRGTLDDRAGRLVQLRRQAGAIRRFVQQVVPRARALVPLLRAERPDIVHLGNSIKANLDGVVAARWAHVPVLAHEKGLVGYGPLERFWARGIDSCVCMTDAVRRHLVSQGVRPRRLTVVHDGLDLTRFRPARDPATVRTELGLGADQPAIGMAVNIQPWKGQDVTLRAVAALAEEFPDLVCVLAGGVVRGAEPFAAALDEFVRARGLAGRVRFLGARSDVPDLLSALDVVVHASVLPEPFGRILIEAMALGKPVVASNAGGVPEIVVDGRTGVLVPPRDHGALAHALGTLLRDPARRARMGAEARARVREHFSVERFARAMQGIYAEMLGG